MLGKRARFRREFVRVFRVDRDRIADRYFQFVGKELFHNALTAALRFSSLLDPQFIDPVGHRKNGHRIFADQCVQIFAAFRVRDRGQPRSAGIILQGVDIVLRHPQRGKDPDIHQVLFIVIDVQRMLHVRRRHAKAGKKADCQEIHYEERNEFFSGMQDLSDCIGQ